MIGLVLFDPIYILISILGYIIIFILAGFIAPKIANRFSGKFSLYTSMLLLSFLIVFSTLGSFFLFFYVLNSYFGLGISDFASLLSNILVLIILSNILLYLFSPLVINIAYGAEENEDLQRMVDKVKKDLNYRGRIKAVVTRSFTIPNAFAYGNFLFGKYVAVTPGMLNLMNENELRAVIGHELGHHMHRDNFVMLIFGLLPSLIYFFGYYLIRLSLYYRPSNRRETQANVFLALVGFLGIIISFIVQILVLAFSRMREYFSDTEGAKAAGKINMQTSLAKLHYYYTANLNSLRELKISKLRTLFLFAFLQTLANPIKDIEIPSQEKIKKKVEEIKKEKVNPLQEFLSTHPPIPKRLRFLDTLDY